MFSICLPRVTSHYSEMDVRDAINQGLDGEFVSTIDTRTTTDSKGLEFQVMFVHFLEKEGNERTAEFFQRLEKQGEVKFYTGATDKRRWIGKDVPNPRFGDRFYWKVRKNTSKRTVPGLMTEDEEAKLQVPVKLTEAALEMELNEELN
jgi:hypothetical protein